MLTSEGVVLDGEKRSNGKGGWGACPSKCEVEVGSAFEVTTRFKGSGGMLGTNARTKTLTWVNTLSNNRLVGED